MGPFLQFVFLFVCWLSALATLLVFLESWFAFSGRGRFTARRASGAYGVISVFVPMQGSIAKLERTIRSIFSQSYPFIELLLIHSEEEQHFARVAKEFRSARSHIPVRVVATPFQFDSPHERTRALEQAQSNVRGRWLVILAPDVVLDRFAIESALDFSGSIGSEATGLIAVSGLVYGLSEGIDNFTGASILAFSAVSYALMALSYYFYARRLRATGWFAPLWFISHFPAAILTLLEMSRKARAF